MDAIIQLLETRADLPISPKLLDRLQKLLEANQNDSQAQTALALCYDRLGLPDLAKKEFALAVADTPDNPTAMLKLIRLKLRQGEIKSAAILLQAAYNKFPDDPDTMFWYGNYLKSNDKNLDAARLFKAAMAKNPRILGLNSALAEIELEENHYVEAIEFANKDLAIDQHFILANEIKATALSNLSHYSEAAALFQKCYQVDPTRAELGEKYANACYWLGDYQQALLPALGNLALSARFNSSNFAAKSLVMTVISKMSKTDVAKAIAADDNEVARTFHNPDYHFAIAAILDAAGLHDSAIGQYQEGLSSRPNFAAGLFELGRDLQIYRHDYKQAMNYYDRAYTLAPRNPELNAYRNQLSMHLKQPSQDIAWNLKDFLHNLFH